VLGLVRHTAPDYSNNNIYFIKNRNKQERSGRKKIGSEQFMGRPGGAGRKKLKGETEEVVTDRSERDGAGPGGYRGGDLKLKGEGGGGRGDGGGGVALPQRPRRPEVRVGRLVRPGRWRTLPCPPLPPPSHPTPLPTHQIRQIRSSKKANPYIPIEQYPIR